MRVWGGVREARGWCSVLGVPVPLLTLRYVPLAVPASLDEAILLTVSPKGPHQNLPMGGACGKRGEVGGRHRWEGLDWKLSWIYQQYLVSVAGEVRGQIEIDERRSKALKPPLSITLPPASSAL